MKRPKATGFSLMEIMFTAVLVGIVTMFMMPHVLFPNRDEQGDALIRESFTTLGDMYLARVTNPNYADPTSTSGNTNPEEIGGSNANATFAQFIYAHLHYSTAMAPSGITADTYCNTTQNYFTFPLGTAITNICSCPAAGGGTQTNCKSFNGANAGIDTMQVTVTVPTRNGQSSETYTLVIPENENRYTTLRGFDSTQACTYTDKLLHIDTTCT